MGKFGRERWLLAGLLSVAFAAALPAEVLFPGAIHPFQISPRSQVSLATGVQFTSPPGASRIVLEVETNNPAHDIDLFARFDRDVERDEDEVIADYSSETPASGIESIELDFASVPPLQTGTYFVGLLVKTLDTKITGTIRLTIESAGKPETFLISTFDGGNLEGWMRNFPSTGLPGATQGDFAGNIFGDPAGFLTVQDFDGPSRDYAVAPAKFIGGLASFSNARFEFDYRHRGQFEVIFPIEVRLIGGGSAYRWIGPKPPPDEWIHVEVPVLSSEWELIAGSGAFSSVLRNLQRIEISMDQAFLAEKNDLDNFEFHGEKGTSPTGPPDGPTSSTFEGSFDGWTRNYPSTGIAGERVGESNSTLTLASPGAGSDGFLLHSDAVGRGNDYFLLPPKYLGNLAALDRPWFEFDLRRVAGEFPDLPVHLRILGSDAVYLWTGARPRSTWEHFRVPLDAAHWVLFEGTAGFDQMLRSVERVELSADFALGAEQTGLDNFHLRTEFTGPVGRALKVDRNVLNLGGNAGGPVFPAETFAITATGGNTTWRARVDPVSATWVRLASFSGVTPASLVVTADPAGLPAGVHRASIVITSDEFGVPGQTIVVTLDLEDGSAPAISPGGVVHSANPELPLSPGVLASVFGVNFAAAEQLGMISPSTGQLERNLLGVEVLVRRLDGTLIAAAPLLFAGPGQANFQMPYEAAGEALVDIVVRVNGVESAAETVALSPTGPGLFVLAGDQAAVLNQDFSRNTPGNPAARGTIIVAFLSGVGLATPPTPTGAPAAAIPLSFVNAAASATIGGVNVPEVSLVLAPGFVGLAQANIELAAGTPAGQQALVITVGGQASNAATVSVE